MSGTEAFGYTGNSPRQGEMLCRCCVAPVWLWAANLEKLGMGDMAQMRNITLR
jgi:hypothetical protein